ncbi:MAG: single-stranded DNA-binding protein [Mycoplasma sp.]|nr:single-stranded DNA-binding protein [Mycoplasma sp.]
MINRVIIVGRLVSDPNLNQTSSGISYARFTVASTYRFSSNNENNNTDFIPVVAWRQAADVVGKYTKKGSLIAVEGRFTSSSYKKDGENITRYEVTAENIRLLESKSKSNNSNSDTLTFANENSTKTENKKENKKENSSLPWDIDL